MVGLALILGLAAYLNHRWQEHRTDLATTALEDRASAAAGQLASLVTRSLPELTESVDSVAQNGLSPGELERATGGIDSAWALDADGKVRVATPNAGGRPTQAERAAVASGQLEIFDLLETRGGKEFVPIAFSLHQSEPIIGAVAHFPKQLAEAFIGSAIAEVPETPLSRAAVFDSNGALVVASGIDAGNLAELGAATRTGRQGAIDYDGVESLLASSEAVGTPWTVALAAPRSDVMPGGQDSWLGWVAIAVFALVGLAGIFLLIRVINGAEEIEEMNRRLRVRTQEAEEATHVKNEFISSMAHELRTPLAAIKMFTDLMRENEEEPPTGTQARSLDDIAASTKHILELLDDTMDIARVESGQLPLHPERVSAAALAIGIVDGLNPLAAERGLSLTLEADGSIGEVFLDPARLRQVLINLLSNALKFTRPGGRVILSLSRHGPSAFAVSVEDTGIGIAADRIDELFTSMRRIATPVHEQDSSRGLGLALTKRIVEAMGGHVGVESASGEGSTFYAVLPRVNAERRAGVDATSIAGSGSVLTDPAPGRDTADRQFSALGIRSEAQPGHNFGVGREPEETGEPEETLSEALDEGAAAPE